MRLFGSDRIRGMVDRLGLPDDQPIDARILSNSIENAQKRLEGENFNLRKNVLEYDDVMNQQRNIIYGERRRELGGEDISGTVKKMIETSVSEGISASVDPESGAVSKEELRKNLFWLLSENDFADAEITVDAVRDVLLPRAEEIYEKQQEIFGENMRELERVALLRSVDTHWMAHLDAMDDLRGGVGLAAYAQRNPLNEYRIAAGEMFENMIADIRTDTVRMILFSRPAEQIKRAEIAKQKAASVASVGGETVKKRPVVKKAAEKIGRNDPCPCGSGKKYKKCCGANIRDEQ